MPPSDVADSPSSQSTSTNLLKQVVEGDQEAWNRFVSIYGGLIYAGCRRFGVSPHDAADLVQNVLIRVLKSIGTLRRDQPGQGLRLWLRRVARNVVNDHFRQLGKEKDALRRREFPGNLDELLSPMHEHSDSWVKPPDVVLALRQALSSIKNDYEDKTWQAFWRSVAENQAPADVASDLGMTPASIRQARYKIRKRLRKMVQEFL